jgi:peptidoglycan hydrolase CwlO-like protein
MPIPSLDTLDIAKRLKEAGFSDSQAEAVTTVFRDVRAADLGNLATKADIQEVRAEIQAMRAEVRAEIQAVRVEVRTDIQSVRAEVRADIQSVRADIQHLDNKVEILRRDITIRLGGMIAAANGILLAAKFFG